MIDKLFKFQLMFSPEQNFHHLGWSLTSNLLRFVEKNIMGTSAFLGRFPLYLCKLAHIPYSKF